MELQDQNFLFHFSRVSKEITLFINNVLETNYDVVCSDVMEISCFPDHALCFNYAPNNHGVTSHCHFIINKFRKLFQKHQYCHVKYNSISLLIKAAVKYFLEIHNGRININNNGEIISIALDTNYKNPDYHDLYKILILLCRVNYNLGVDGDVYMIPCTDSNNQIQGFVNLSMANRLHYREHILEYMEKTCLEIATAIFNYMIECNSIQEKKLIK